MQTSIPLVLVRNLLLDPSTLDDSDSVVVVKGSNNSTVRVPWSTLKEGFITTAPSVPGSSTADGSSNQIVWSEDGLFTYRNGQWGKSPRVLTNWSDFTPTSRFLRLDAEQGLTDAEAATGRQNLHILSATTQKEGLVRLTDNLNDNTGAVPTAETVKKAIEEAHSSDDYAGDVIAGYTGDISLKTSDGVKALVYDKTTRSLDVGVGADTVNFNAGQVVFRDEDGNIITTLDKLWDDRGPVDASYDSSSENAQAGTAVAEAITPVTRYIDDVSNSVKELSSKVDAGLKVDVNYYEKSTNAQAGTAVYQAVAPVREGLSDLQEYVQTLSDRLDGWDVTGLEVDEDYSPGSPNAQSGLAVSQPVSKLTDDLEYWSTLFTEHKEDYSAHLTQEDRSKLDRLDESSAMYWTYEDGTLQPKDHYNINRVSLYAPLTVYDQLDMYGNDVQSRDKGQWHVEIGDARVTLRASGVLTLAANTGSMVTPSIGMDPYQQQFHLGFATSNDDFPNNYFLSAEADADGESLLYFYAREAYWNSHRLSQAGFTVPDVIKWSSINSGPSSNWWSNSNACIIDCTGIIDSFYTSGVPSSFNSDNWSSLLAGLPSSVRPSDGYSTAWTLIFLGPTSPSSGTYFDADAEFTLVSAKKNVDMCNLPEVKVGYRTMTVVKLVRYGSWTYGIVQQTA